MIRLLAIAAALIAAILFIVVAAFTPSDPGTLSAWGFVCVALCLFFLALEPLVPAGYRRAPPA